MNQKRRIVLYSVRRARYEKTSFVKLAKLTKFTGRIVFRWRMNFCELNFKNGNTVLEKNALKMPCNNCFILDKFHLFGKCPWRSHSYSRGLHVHSPKKHPRKSLLAMQGPEMRRSDSYQIWRGPCPRRPQPRSEPSRNSALPNESRDQKTGLSFFGVSQRHPQQHQALLAFRCRHLTSQQFFVAENNSATAAKNGSSLATADYAASAKRN